VVEDLQLSQQLTPIPVGLPPLVSTDSIREELFDFLSVTRKHEPCSFQQLSHRFNTMNKRELQSQLTALCDEPNPVLQKKEIHKSNCIYFLTPKQPSADLKSLVSGLSQVHN